MKSWGRILAIALAALSLLFSIRSLFHPHPLGLLRPAIDVAIIGYLMLPEVQAKFFVKCPRRKLRSLSAVSPAITMPVCIRSARSPGCCQHRPHRRYGDDLYTGRARAKFREHFGDVEVYFVFNGTAAMS